MTHDPKIVYQPGPTGFELANPFLLDLGRQKLRMTAYQATMLRTSIERALEKEMEAKWEVVKP